MFGSYTACKICLYIPYSVLSITCTSIINRSILEREIEGMYILENEFWKWMEELLHEADKVEFVAPNSNHDSTDRLIRVRENVVKEVEKLKLSIFKQVHVTI